MLLLLLACATDSEDSASATNAACTVVDGRPAGWDEETHGKGDGDYETVFSLDAVHRIDLTLTSDDHDAMYAELAELLGSEFGEGGGGGPGGGFDPGGDTGGDPPDREEMEAAIAACEGLSEGGACSTDAWEGSCAAGPDGTLACMPGGGGSPPSEFTSSDPSYYPVDVTVDGSTWCGVGMRYKGNSTLSGAWSSGVGKLPFRLDFDEFEDDRPELDDQRFHGFEELSFGNGSGDLTLLRDVLASEILADRGLPAARNAFWAVYADWGEGSTYLGLYTAMEDPSDEMMERVYGDDSGNLYKPDGECADLTCFDETTFEKKSNEDAADWSDAEALVAALQADRTDDAAWRAQLEAVLDVDQFIRWLAVNTAMENWDTYGAMSHNYYLYADPSDGRLDWIPWDHNLSLMEGFSGDRTVMHDETDESWPLIRYVLDDATYLETYRAYLAEAQQGALVTDTFSARVTELAALIRADVVAEEDGYTFVASESDFDTALDEILAHRETRRAEVDAALGE